jgi:hypothetical protein
MDLGSLSDSGALATFSSLVNNDAIDPWGSLSRYGALEPSGSLRQTWHCSFILARFLSLVLSTADGSLYQFDAFNRFGSLRCFGALTYLDSLYSLGASRFLWLAWQSCSPSWMMAHSADMDLF